MSNELEVNPINRMFNGENVQSKFHKILGEKSVGFISSVLQTVNNNSLLAKATPISILNAAATAAILNLEINQNLGFAWIVPYKGEAQFQVGWKGFVQLALRTGQYSRINVVELYKNQFKSFNVLTEELDADFSNEGEGEVVGYVAYLKLNNGFEKTVYWSKIKVINHAKKYSKTYGKKVRGTERLIHSPWNDEEQFDAMAKKTVLKNTISKWGIMSIEMLTAQRMDQAVIKDEDVPEYVDNANTIVIDEKKEGMRNNDNQNIEMP